MNVSVLLCSLALFFSGVTQAAEETVKPLQIELVWVSLQGSVVHLDWPSETRWIWKKQPATLGQIGPSEVPVLRTWVEFPKEITITGVDAPNAVATNAPEDSPFSDRERVWAFDIQAPSASLTLDILDSRSQHHSSLGLVIRTLSDRPTLMINTSCTQAGISLRSRDYHGAHFFAGLICDLHGRDVDIYILRSNDSEWKKSSFTAEIGSGSNWFAVRQVLPSQEAAILGTFVVGLPEASKDLRTTSYYVVFQRPSAEFTSSRFGWSAELATSYLNYKDDALSSNLNEFVFTGKMSASYAIVPQAWDIAVNGFITLLPVSVWPNEPSVNPSNPSVRWYGINGRVAYRLPLNIDATSIQVMGGWYFWGMIVPNDPNPPANTAPSPEFGVNNLGGPQLLLRVRRAPVGKHPYAAYLKYAIIQTSPTDLGISNREIALGGSYQLSAPAEPKPFNLNMDISQAHFNGTVSGGVRTLEFLSVSLGVSKVF